MAEPRTWSLKDEEFRAVSALPAGERYNHFVTPDDQGFVVPPGGMADDLRAELALLE